LIQSEYLVLLLSLVYALALLPFAPGFASFGNWVNILSTLLPLFLVAIGETIVLISGGIDLSVTSTIALTSVTGAAIMNQEGRLAGHAFAVPLGAVAMIGLGAVMGLCNGTAVVKFKMPPFMVTLTSM